MNYEFPHITNILDILPAIAGRDEFVVAEKEGYTVINYNVVMADTFPAISSSRETISEVKIQNFDSALRRECRGIIFNTATGELIRRPFHKFFNINERAETQQNSISLADDHVIMDKLDGSMIAPFLLDDQLIWGTKMGATDVARPVEQFVAQRENYRRFARAMCLANMTPIFEWCSNKQRIVLNQPEDQLILTAIRNMKTGKYYTRFALEKQAKVFGIPFVKTFNFDNNMDEFIKMVHDMQDIEGFVVQFDDGHMVKLKCHWYVQIHKAKEAILQDRNIVELILEDKLDDVKAHLPEEDRDRIAEFEGDINEELFQIFKAVEEHLEEIKIKKLDRKTFALDHAAKIDPYLRPIIFKNFDGEVSSEKIKDDVRNVLRNNLGKTVKYEAIREAWFKGVEFN